MTMSQNIVNAAALLRYLVSYGGDLRLLTKV